MSWINQGSERGQCLWFNTCLLCAQSSGLDTWVPCSEWTPVISSITPSLSLPLSCAHTYAHTHLIYLYSPSQKAHNLHFSDALHFALYLKHAISSSNINSHLCCRPAIHTHTQIFSLISHSATHLMSLCCHSVWNDMLMLAAIRASCLLNGYPPDFIHNKLW